MNLTESCSSLSPPRVRLLPSNPLKSSLYLYLWKTKWLQRSLYMPQDIQGWCACTALQSHFYFTFTQFRMRRKLEPSAVFYRSILSMWAEELPYQLKWMKLNKRMGWKSSLFLWFSKMETSSLPNHWMRYSLGNLSIKPELLHCCSVQLFFFLQDKATSSSNTIPVCCRLN